jgi:hypothetical protein
MDFDGAHDESSAISTMSAVIFFSMPPVFPWRIPRELMQIPWRWISARRTMRSATTRSTTSTNCSSGSRFALSVRRGRSEPLLGAKPSELDPPIPPYVQRATRWLLLILKEMAQQISDDPKIDHHRGYMTVMVKLVKKSPQTIDGAELIKTFHSFLETYAVGRIHYQ